MDEKPRRRWFRFRLSTVLILTAIVAGGMACRPFVVLRWDRVKYQDWVRAARSMGPAESKWRIGMGPGDTASKPYTYWIVSAVPNPRLAYVALVIVASLLLKLSLRFIVVQRPALILINLAVLLAAAIMAGRLQGDIRSPRQGSRLYQYPPNEWVVPSPSHEPE